MTLSFYIQTKIGQAMEQASGRAEFRLGDRSPCSQASPKHTKGNRGIHASMNATDRAGVDTQQGKCRQQMGEELRRGKVSAPGRYLS